MYVIIEVRTAGGQTTKIGLAPGLSGEELRNTINGVLQRNVVALRQKGVVLPFHCVYACARAQASETGEVLDVFDAIEGASRHLTPSKPMSPTQVMASPSFFPSSPPPAMEAEDSVTSSSVVVTRGTEAAEVTRLRRELARIKRLNKLQEAAQIDTLQRDVGPDGLTASEIEAMRQVFELFDTNESGCVTVDSIAAVHEKLGEPLTQEEREDVRRELVGDDEDEVTFDKFLSWWTRLHLRKRHSKWSSKFAITGARLLSDAADFDVSKVVVKHVGSPGSRQYRVRFHYKRPNGALTEISPWHDIPLHHGQSGRIFNAVIEIPRWTRAKYEISTGEEMNPIKQDVKNGKLRYYQYGDIMFNYGAMPQTWENPKHIDESSGLPGDNDPIDLLEIGSRQLPVGSVVPVKVLGCFCLIDDEETDWKLIVIRIGDPLAAKLKDIDDVETHLPGALDACLSYFRNYKIVSQGHENSFALDGQVKNRAFATEVIERTHVEWMKLRRERKQSTV